MGSNHERAVPERARQNREKEHSVGRRQPRIAVRDHATQKIGSANQFIEVPDIKKGRLTLSGISIRGVTPLAEQ